MQARRIFVDFMRATPHKIGQSFYEIVEAYGKGRPFDSKDNVINAMSVEQKAEFRALWNYHVQSLQVFEASLEISFPLTAEKLSTILFPLDAKLTLLTQQLCDELETEIKLDNPLFRDDLSVVQSVARGYAFHLLTATSPIASVSDTQQIKVYQEFHRIVRNVLFGVNIMDDFIRELKHGFKQTSYYNKAKIKLYTAAFGDLAAQAYADGLTENINSLTAFELLEVYQTLSDITNPEIKKKIADQVSSVWDAAWTSYINRMSESEVSCRVNLFTQIRSVMLTDTIKRQIVDKLVEFSVNGNFVLDTTNKNLVQRENFVIDFMSACEGTDYQASVKAILSEKFHDTKSKVIRDALGMKSRNVFGKLFFAVPPNRAESGGAYSENGSGPRFG